MNKAFNGKLFENYPSVNTPLGESMLNPIVVGLNEVDDRVVRHETTKANLVDMYTAITGVSLDKNTGIFTFTRHNGTTIPINTALEKVIMNWRFDKQTQTLYLIMQDGSEMAIDLSAFITNVEFRESETIRPVIGSDGFVSFTIIDGSITGEKLEPNYLAEILKHEENTENYMVTTRGYMVNASTQAANAENSAIRAEEAAEKAEEIAGGNFATNERVDNILNGTTPAGDSKKLNGLTAEEFVQGVSPYFESGETILDWANNPNGVYKKFIISPYFPSDAPKTAEGWCELLIDKEKNRKSVKYTQFGSDSSLLIYERSIWNKAWRGNGWTKANDGGNADTVDGAHLSDIKGWVFSQCFRLDGSVPMSGQKFMLNNGKGHVKEDSNCIMLYTFPSGGTTNEFNTEGATGFLAYAKNYSDANNMPIADRIQCKIDNVNYKMLHTGNKPTGSYTGNGDATARTINTGGVGNAIMLWMNNGTIFVGPSGGIGNFYNSAHMLFNKNELKFENGILTIASSNLDINADGHTVNYQVL